jgi:hypothetical protein
MAPYSSTKTENDFYLKLIEAVSSLSNLFSDSITPYINYRVAENIFCKAFGAENLSRTDTAFDARKRDLGIGIKTFICTKKTKTEKIAEFNSLSPELRKLKGLELAEKLGTLRNERIEFAKRTYDITNGIYHCITRAEKQIKIFDTPYDSVNLMKLKVIKDTEASFSFKDDLNEYNFNHSKSTLFKRFEIPNNAIKIDIRILVDPFELLLRLLDTKGLVFERRIGQPGIDYVILPLYALGLSKNGKKAVGEKSGLNQWNAGGRERNIGEVYIPVPAQIHKYCSGFFPKKDAYFELRTPTNEVYNASICQQNSKALMTKHNKDLSGWLLRKVLKLKEGELATYEKLQEVGVDSVIVTKEEKGKYKIDFSPLDSYEEFMSYMAK